MKKIRNNIFACVMLYKTSFALNPMITIISTAIVVGFVVSIAKIFGM